jgi:hypothetical protein
MEEIHIPDGDEDEVFVIYDSATHEAVWFVACSAFGYLVRRWQFEFLFIVAEEFSQLTNFSVCTTGRDFIDSCCYYDTPE